MLLGKGPAGVRFQVPLERKDLYSLPEEDSGFDSPRCKLGRVRYFECIMCFQAVGQVLGHADVVTVRMLDAVKRM